MKKHNSSGYTEIIASKGIEVLSKNSKLASVDYFDVLEEIYLSVVELKLQDWALVILQIMNQYINGSSKSHRYHAIYREMIGETQLAQNLYWEILV